MKNILEKVKNQSPLVHCMTNYVAANDTANAILALGASPIMADEIDEMKDICMISDTLLINIGTINRKKFNSMIFAGKEARANGTPIIFDPVGVGASSFRRNVSKIILKEAMPDIIKGNISEIKFLHNEGYKQKGVDSEYYNEDSLEDYIEICKKLSQKHAATVVMTGEIDIITNSKKVALIRNGNNMMEKVTGTGCMLGGVIGSLCLDGVEAFESAVLGTLLFNIAGDRAKNYVDERDLGFGSFRVKLIDFLSKVTEEDIKGEMDIEIY